MSEIGFLVLRLAKQYVEDAARLIDALRRHFSCQDILQAQKRGNIPRHGELQDDTHFEFHGVGCLFNTPSKRLDLDFGPGGRFDGFDAWRLYHFVSENDLGVGKPTLREIEEGILELNRCGKIENPRTDPSPHLWYFATKVQLQNANRVMAQQTVGQRTEM